MSIWSSPSSGSNSAFHHKSLARDKGRTLPEQSEVPLWLVGFITGPRKYQQKGERLGAFIAC